MYLNAPSRGLALRLAVVLVMLLGLLGFRVSPALAQEDIFINEFRPFTVVQFNPCALGGEGELVQVDGQVHVIFFEKYNGNGHSTQKSQINAVNVTAVGLTTGIEYRVVGGSRSQSTVKPNDDGAFTLVNQMMYISPGREPNMVVHDTFHVTVNQDGVEVNVVENSFIKCN